MIAPVALLQPIELDYIVLAVMLREPEFWLRYSDQLRGHEFDSLLVAKVYRFAKGYYEKREIAPDLAIVLECLELSEREREQVIDASAAFYAKASLAEYVHALVIRGARKSLLRVAELTVSQLQNHPNRNLEKAARRLEAVASAVSGRLIDFEEDIVSRGLSR